MSAKTRVFIVYPGHGTATIDVARGLHSGFLANDCEVTPFLLHAQAAWFGGLLSSDKAIPEELKTDASFVLAASAIPAAVLRSNKPDLIVVVHGLLVPEPIWESLQIIGQSICPVHLVCTECPYQDADIRRIAPYATNIWANDAYSARDNGWYYLPAAYDPERHHPPDEPIAGCPDLLFVGTGWPERVEFLRSVNFGALGLRIVGPEYSWAAAEGTDLEKCIETCTIPGPALWAYYAGSGAVLNMHRTCRSILGDSDKEDPVQGYSLNPRCYQVPACGGLLLSDYRPEWDDVFGACLRPWKDAEDLGDMARILVGNPELRAEIIGRTMEAVKPHTYHERAAQILESATAKG